ncbi:MAG: amino acid adenylation domain-containing protein [Cytophagales bacterium]|nr:amino acid adenylation domain-containing protein [Cytophagales bacterium]
MKINVLINQLRKVGVVLSLEAGKLKVKAPKGQIPPELLQELKAQKEAIVDYLTTSQKSRSYEKIPHCPEDTHYQVSHAQRGLWIQDQLSEKSLAYNIHSGYRLQGKFDESAFEKALDAISKRHEILRTSIETVQGEPVQLIQDDFSFQLLKDDISDHKDKEARIEQLSYEEAVTPFDLSKAPLWRVKWVRLGADEFLLLFSMHHIISDGWSLHVLVKELLALYHGFVQNKDPQLPPLPIQHKDYSHWQNQVLASDKGKASCAYWQDRLAGELPVLNLTSDKKRPKIKTNHGAVRTHVIDAETLNLLKSWSKAHDASLFMTMTAILKVLLYRYTGQTDLIIGSPVANRLHSDLEGQIGYFVNTIALRSEIDGGVGFNSFLTQVKNTVLGAFEHQMYPFDAIVDELDTERNLSRNPIFDVVIMMPNNDQADFQLEDVHLSRLNNPHHTSRFDMHFNIIEKEEELLLHVIYNTDLFEEGRVQRLQLHFEQLCKQILTDELTPLSALPMLHEDEKQVLLNDFAKGSDVPHDKGLIEWFQKQVETSPDQVAVSTEETSLTYQELNEKANRLAHFLMEMEMEEGERVGVYLQRSPQLMISLLGILKTGAAYVLLDPHQRGERLGYVIEDAEIEMVLVEKGLVENLNLSSIDILVMDDDVIGPDWLEVYETTNPENEINPASTAYIMYTSGSSGKPKGVEIPHAGLSDYLGFASEKYYEDHLQGSLVASAHWFDLTLPSLYLPLLHGGQVRLLREEQVLTDLTERLKTTDSDSYLLRLTPVHIKGLLELLAGTMNLPQKHVFVIGGARFSPDLYRQLRLVFPQAIIYNHYGPTETVVGCAIYQVNDLDENSDTIPIGRPMNNTSLYVLDEALKPVPIGVPGELHVAGICVSNGYLNQPDLTQARFIDNPYGPRRLYKTGDLAQWRADGLLDYVGRLDDQVKIRGHRIEPEEIAQVLMKHDKVPEAIVLPIQNDLEEYELVAGVVASHLELNGSLLRDFLESRLPDYMIPQHFVLLDSIPTTTNGKVDKKAVLKAVQEQNLGEEDSYVAPQTAGERLLAEIWKEVLSRKVVSATDNFFHIGGDSIKAIQISSRVHQAGQELTLKTIFEYPVLKDQAKKLKTVIRMPDQGIIEGEVPFTPIQRRFLNRQLATQHHYNQAILVRIPEELDESTLCKIFEHLQQHHDALRMVFPDDSGSLTQYNPLDGQPIDLATYDFRSITDEELEVKVQDQVNEIQGGIDLQAGPLMKLALFTERDQRRLLVVIHHLVIDLVSWRVLSEDLETLYDQHQQGKEFKLPPKTDAYQLWANRLAEASKDKSFSAPWDYWRKLDAQIVDRLPLDHIEGSNLECNSVSKSIRIEGEMLELLTNQVHQAFNTTINDLLLSALGAAVGECFGVQKVPVMLESHGREIPLEDLDVSRTVGWFSSVYPVLVETHGAPAELLVNVKEMLRKIPQKGIGYELYRQQVASEAKQGLQPQLIFNFTGQFDNTVSEDAAFILSGQARNTLHPETPRLYELDFSGQLSKSELVLTVRYSDQRYRSDTIDHLMASLSEQLTTLIEACAQLVQPVRTPSDFTFGALSVEELAQLETQYPGNIADIYPLLPTQEGMLFHALYEKEKGAYFEQKSFQLGGYMDPDLVENAFNVLFKRHDILRAALIYEDLDQPVQVILKQREIDFAFHDIREIAPEQQEQRIATFKAQDKAKGFELDQDPLMRVSLLQTTESQYEIIWSHHHMILDGWSSSKLTEEWLQVYQELSKRSVPEIAENRVFKDYVRWQQSQLPENSLDFWKNFLQGYSQQISLPGRQSSSTGSEYRNRRSQITLDAELAGQLQRLANEHQASLSTLMQTIWGILLSKYNQTNDAVFGVVVSGRPPEVAGAEDLVGVFINTIPCRVSMKENHRFDDLLSQMQGNFIETAPHQYVALSDIQQVSESGSSGELVNHIMVFQNFPVEEDLVRGLMDAEKDEQSLPFSFAGHADIWEQTNYDFNIVVVPSGEELIIRFMYNDLIYPESNMDRVAEHLKCMVTQVVDQPNIEIDAIKIISDAEEKLLAELSGGQSISHPEHQTVISLFEKQVEEQPDEMALVYSDRSLTYRELKDQVDQLAQYLVQEVGLQPEEVVGCMTGRDSWSVVALLAVMKVGGVYLPLELTLPNKRLVYITDNSQCQVVLTHKEQLDLLKENAISAVDVSAISLDGFDATHIDDAARAGYLVYTSGSTGNPKGVLGTQVCLHNLICWQHEQFQTQRGLKSLQYAAQGFDVALQEMLFSVVFGGTLYGVSDEVKSDPSLLAGVIAKHKIELITMPFAGLNLMLSNADTRSFLVSLKHLITSGEQLVMHDHIREFLQQNLQAQLHNQYGPSETHVITAHTLSGIETSLPTLPPIGKPVSNVQVYLLDERGGLAPFGSTGEIVIGGIALAKGYVGDTSLTESKFIEHDRFAGQRLYKTGDRGRWTENGELEFIGRNDHQIKVRGFRVEPGEVEHHLLNHEAILECAVIVKEEEQTYQNELVAFIRITSEILDEQSIRAFLSDDLPGYMIPAQFIVLEEMPQTSSGKIDRKALVFQNGETLESGLDYLPPESDTEEKLVKIWEELLERERIGIRDHFFEIGGHSLKATRMIGRIQKQFEIKVPLKRLFEAPTIQQLALVIDNILWQQQASSTMEQPEEREKISI